MEPIRNHRADSPARKGAPFVGPGPLAGGSVYPPRADTLLLVPFARVGPGTTLLEVGTGSGLAAVTAARAGARVVATDLNPEALRRLRRRSMDEGLEVAAVRTDLARGLARFDRILCNPPYLPTGPAERDPDRWHNLALDGGSDGCRVLARLVASLEEHLAPHGAAFVVVSSLQDPNALSRIRSEWTGRGGTLEVVERRELEGERLEVWRFAAALE